MRTRSTEGVPRSRVAVATTALVLSAGLLAGCGDDDSATTIDGAWARTSPMMADAGAVYLTISSDDAIVIESARVDASVAGRVELHETVMADMAHGDDMDDDDAMADDDMADDEMADDEMADDEMADDEMADDEMAEDDMAMGGAMMMQQVDGIEVPAGGSVALEPGGLHVMLLDLPDPLEVGETFDLTLELAEGDPITVEIEVRDEAP